MQDKISQKQLLTLGWVGLMSPIVRLLPRTSAALGGRAAWLSFPIAMVFSILYVGMIYALLKRRAPEQGIAEYVSQNLGKVGGKIFCTVTLVWLLFYSGFILAGSAERLITCVYPTGNRVIIIVVMAALVLFASMGRIKTLAGAGMIFAIMIAAVMLFVWGFSVTEVKPEYILPVTAGNIPGVIKAAVPAVDIVTGLTYFLFLLGDTDTKTMRRSGMIKWAALLMLVGFMVTVITIGTFSANVAKNFQYPFFTLIRNISVVEIVERVEALIIAVWVCADFVYLTSLAHVMRRTGKTALKTDSPMMTTIYIIVVTATSVYLGRNAFTLSHLSTQVIPTVNMAYTIIIIPAVLALSGFRKEIKKS